MRHAAEFPAIPHYELLTELGSSLYSTVYIAVPKFNPQRTVVLKVLKRPLRLELQRRYVRQKIERLKVIHDPNLIVPSAFETYGELQFLVQDHFPGITLDAWRRTHAPVAIEDFLSIALELAQAVSAVHEAGIVHGGIKPHNILIRADTLALRLVDFISPIDIRELSHFIYDRSFVEGTLAYTSPEQTGRINHRVDFSSDMYSLAVTFYELLTGRLPYKTTDPLALIHSHLAEEAPPVHRVNPAVPEMLSRIIAKLSLKEPEKRYQSGAGLYADLMRCKLDYLATGSVSEFRLCVRDHVRRVVFISRMVGRDFEASRVLQAYDAVTRGEFRSIFISGLPGIGKTRLIQELQRPLVQHRGYFTSGKFDQYQKNIPYSSLLQALRNLIRTFLTESNQRVQNWRRKILAAVGHQGRLLTDVVPELEILIGPQPDVPPLPPVEARRRFNNLFGDFLACMATEENPLVLFIDDLQWCDSATFDFLDHVFSDTRRFPHLFFIGAYRNNEVDSAHHLSWLLRAIADRNQPIEALSVGPLDISHCREMVAYILDLPLHETAALSAFVADLTDGNPLFVSESLSWLHGQDLLELSEDGQWRWDMEKIHASNMPPTVVELFGAKVRKLPEETLSVLMFCACMGNRFSAEDVALIQELDVKTLYDRLKAVLGMGLLMESKSDLQFVHDRVQEAVLRLLDAEQRRVIHWRIGRHLLDAVPAETELARHDDLFTIIAHLNLGKPADLDAETARMLANLNYQAGEKALEALATQAANAYFRAGLELLPGDCWETCYRETFLLHQRLAKSELMCGRQDQSERLIDTLLEHAADDLDRAEALAEQTTSLSSIGNFIKAIEAANRGLSLFGKAIPTDAALARARMQDLMDDIHADDRNVWHDILNMRFTDQRQSRIELKFYSELIPDLYMSGLVPQLYLSAAQSTRHCLDGGMDESVIYSFSIMGLNLGEQGEFERAFRYEDLARELCARYPDTFGATRGMNGIVWCNMHSRSHPREIIEYSRKGIQCGKNCGDLYNAGLSYGPLMWNEQVMGADFDRLEATVEECLEFSRRNQLEFSVGLAEAVKMGWVLPMKQAAATIQPIDDLLARWEERNHVASAGSYFVHLGLTHFYFDRHREAEECLERVHDYLQGLTDNVLKRQWYVFRILNTLRLYQTGRFAGDGKMLEAQLAPWLEPVEVWAKLGPLLRPYLALLRAEWQRALGRFDDTRSAYLDAIEMAHREGYAFLEAYINESLGEFLIGAQQRTADIYLRQAVGLYRTCRARGKEIRLIEKHPQRLAESALHRNDAGNEPLDDSVLPSLDIDYLMKSARALSAEIDLESLGERFVAVMLEVSGAQSGFLVRQDDEAHPRIIVEQRTGQKPGAPLGHGAPELCLGIVNFVMRTKQSVILDDAQADASFGALPEVVGAGLRSVLCLPILQQGRATGAVYLENRLSPGLFPPNKVRVAELLTAQAAISLENALLIQDMRQTKDDIEQLNATLEDRVKDEVAKSREKDHLLIRQSRLALMGEMIGNIAHQWRQPLNALALVLENIRDAHAYGELDGEYLQRQSDDAQRLIQKMSSTINDFRNFFRPDKQKESFSLLKVIDDTLTLIAGSIRAHAIDLVREIPKDAWTEGYPNEYSQVLLNLLTNAKEAIQNSRQRAGRIIIRLQDDGELTRLTIADNGGGIDENALGRIFEPYFSTKESGTGIGLYMSKMIIKNNMDGTIEARNAGEGAEFTIVMRSLKFNNGETAGVDERVSIG